MGNWVIPNLSYKLPILYLISTLFSCSILLPLSIFVTVQGYFDSTGQRTQHQIPNM